MLVFSSLRIARYTQDVLALDSSESSIRALLWEDGTLTHGHFSLNKTLSMYWPSFVHRSLSRRRIVSSAYHLLAPIRRYNKCSGPSASLLSPGKDIIQPEKATSLSWVQIFDESPASYGIDSWGGYVEMIPPKARLPYEKVLNLENALDYISHGMFTVYYRHSILKAPIELAKIELKGLRVAKEGLTKMKAAMTIGKDLSGTFKVQDNYTKSAASVRFDAGVSLQILKSDGVIKSNE